MISIRPFSQESWSIESSLWRSERSIAERWPKSQMWRERYLFGSNAAERPAGPRCVFYPTPHSCVTGNSAHHTLYYVLNTTPSILQPHNRLLTREFPLLSNKWGTETHRVGWQLDHRQGGTWQHGHGTCDTQLFHVLCLLDSLCLHKVGVFKKAWN